MKIAIIGSGISGLGAAYLLHKKYDITLYEKNAYLGGHSRTLDIPVKDKIIPVDTGFIVFNYRNYPYLTALFEHLNVPIAKSDMSFGVSIQNNYLEYGTQFISNMFAQKRNILRPAFLKMIWDVLRFNRHSHQYCDMDTSISLGQCLDELYMGEWFKQYYLLAMGGAIWSTSPHKMLDFPAKTFIQFFKNHGLLTVNDQPQWYTVKGGSKEYVQRIASHFKEHIKLNCGVKKVIREAHQITLIDEHGEQQAYDQVIFACHSDQVLHLLHNPTHDEQHIIGQIDYQPNTIIVHSDINFMPKRRKAWSSWVYLSEEKEHHHNSVSLSYWMNNLQPLNTDTPIIVTLNPHKKPDADLIYDEYTFEHPVFDEAAIMAQDQLDHIQGKDRLWFCGAWQGYGFHEDGLSSAVQVAQQLDAELPWK